MKVIITKKQYKNLAFSLLENIVGDLKLDSKYIPGEAFIKVLDSYGKNIMDVWLRKSAIPKGCKKELNVSIETSELIFNYLPLVRKKIFSEVFLEYFYMKTKYKCDCVDFYYPIEKKDENDDFVYRKFQYKKKKKYIKESVDKNKKFLIDVMGIDFTDEIQQITSTYDVPMSFDDGISPLTIKMYLNLWGPMYLFELDGVKYLYQDRGDFEMFIDEEGNSYVDGEILEELGIGVMGLKFSHIIDIFFNED